MTDSNISDLCPELQAIYARWLEQCHAIPLATKAIVTWRSGVDQDAAQANGLSKACAGQSPHNCTNPDGEPFSKAFDFAIFNEDGSYVTDGTDSRYKQAGEIGEALGLQWGGRWIKSDFDHLELLNWRNT